MLLKSVSFKDYCLYAGEQTFSLSPQKNDQENNAKNQLFFLAAKMGRVKRLC